VGERKYIYIHSEEATTFFCNGSEPGAEKGRKEGSSDRRKAILHIAVKGPSTLNLRALDLAQKKNTEGRKDAFAKC